MGFGFFIENDKPMATEDRLARNAIASDIAHVGWGQDN